MDKIPPVSCERTSYSVDHNIIQEASEEENAVIEAYEEELEWAERNQESVKPDLITQKNV
ncbi:hypothetical protein [Ammoniphilus sp. 3BR4]|uniref:hypothetical protein n=1 Tax=Ammoniphilus sp. 3BR4 TaxID=3158265 RepID=UPI003465CE6E